MLRNVSIVNNEISVDERAEFGVGIMVVSVGNSEKPVEVDVSGTQSATAIRRDQY
jgi:hypothetical protein